MNIHSREFRVRRRRSSPAEDIIDIASHFPWWVGTLLAIISYLILHQFADIHFKGSLVPGQMGSAVVQKLWRTLAYFGQFVLPCLFLFGAIVSATKQSRGPRTKPSAGLDRSDISLFLESILFQGKFSLVTACLLSLLIVMVTILCISVFHSSPGFLTLFVLLFILSAVNAVRSATVTAKTEEASAGFNHGKPQQGGSVQSQGPTVDFPQPEESKEKSYLSLNQYLQLNSYMLSDEIIDAIEWKRFEMLCHLIFRATGYNAYLTGDGADEGVDIRIYDNNDHAKVVYLVQCKKWSKRTKVDRPLVQQLRGQMAAERVDKGGYCVTSGFTSLARGFAAANNIELFDQQRITTTFNKLDINVRETILTKILEGDYWTPSCASCGDKFQVAKVRNGKMVWGCSNSRKHGWSSIPFYEAAPIKNVR